MADLHWRGGNWHNIFSDQYPIKQDDEWTVIRSPKHNSVVYIPHEEFELEASDSNARDWDDETIIRLLKAGGHPYDPRRKDKEPIMLEKLIRLYTAYMAQDVRSPTPHLAGPPGVGKSEAVEQLAELLGVNLHILNVARISPLEIEGVQMPVTLDDETKLHMLHSTVWTQLKEGDIVFLDEFMRGFPEVYNGLLDIMTSRKVAGFSLPKVFFVAASNSIAAYDKALEDRLLHIFVSDIRKSQTARMREMEKFVTETGMLPDMVKSNELSELFAQEVLPMYEILDQFKGTAARGTTTIKGQSARKLAGMVKLREVSNELLKDLIDYNNATALRQSKAQFVILLSGRKPDPKYVKDAAAIQSSPKLTQIQAINLRLNMDLIAMEEANTATPEEDKEETPDDDDIF